MIRYLHADNVGSVRLITNSAAAAIGTADYSPYGTALWAGTSSSFGYANSWSDPVTELDYLRAREYDPSTGQFLQVDPIQDRTRQPYAYAGNNPLGAADPTGRCAADTTTLTKICQGIQYLGFYYSGLGPSVYQSVCGSTDGWTCANVKLNPMYAVIAGVDKCAHAADAYACAVMTFNPVYHVIDGYGQLIADSQNGCDWTVIAQDGLNAVAGVAATVGIAAGAARAPTASGAASVSSSAAARAAGAVVEFGRDANQVSHAFRHTTNSGLDSAAVAGAIRPGATAIGSQLAVGEGAAGTALVNGTLVDYYAFRWEDGTINVARITVRK